ncbi:hypothetical protein [Jiella marina]|uniref:hypothetical protein n=1 Tax=Jiella sp. LLJ827 TaxID=2917712 RepID=UPI0021008BB0|nr:hypothetical protein [Jiella sp. LLJ827]MCQ0989310.1 hypothetical protein [Jiella sp. LLJ827]
MVLVNERRPVIRLGHDPLNRLIELPFEALCAETIEAPPLSPSAQPKLASDVEDTPATLKPFMAAPDDPSAVEMADKEDDDGITASPVTGDEPVSGPSRWPAIALVANGALLATTLSLAAGFFFVKQPVAMLTEMHEELLRMRGSEARLNEQIEAASDRTSKTIAERLDETDEKLAGISSGLGELRTGLEDGVRAIESQSAHADESYMRVLIAISDLAEAKPAETRPPVSGKAARRVAAPEIAEGGEGTLNSLTGAPSSDAARFERVTLADGSVSYRRMR